MNPLLPPLPKPRPEHELSASTTRIELPSPLLKCRLTNIHPISTPPLEGLDQLSSGFSPGGQRFWKVPVIQVFGVTEAGQRACVNIHGAFPYLYIEYPKEMKMDPTTARNFIARLGHALNKALSSSKEATGGKASAWSPNHLQSIQLVKGVPFYGYHVGYRYYLRVAYLRPAHRWTLLKVLGDGGVLTRKWEVFEGHLGFGLQFLCDFGLGGCGWLEIDDARFRKVPDDNKAEPIQPPNTPDHLRIWTRSTTPPSLLHPKSSTFPPTSRAAIELDIHVSAILNRHLISPRPLHHDFTELRLGIPSNTKLVGSLEGLWEDERRRRREAGRDNNLEAKPSQEERVGFEGGQFPGKGVGWNTEQRWWEEVGERFKSDSKLRKSAGKIGKIGFEEFIRSAGGLMQEDREAWDKYIPTTFEALSRGWPAVSLPSRGPNSSQTPIKPRRPPEPPSTLPPSTPFENPDLIVGARSPLPPPLEDGDVDEAIVYEASQRAAQEERDEARDTSLRGRRRGEDVEEGIFPEMEMLPWGEDDGFDGLEGEKKAMLGDPEELMTDGTTYDADGLISYNSFYSPNRPTAGSSPTANNYPYADFFSRNSTTAERKSRSPRSPARISPSKPSTTQHQRRSAHFSAPNTPSRLRRAMTVRDETDDLGEEGADEGGKDEGSPTLRSQRLRPPIPFAPGSRSSGRAQSASDAQSSASSNPFFLSSSSSSTTAPASKDSSNRTRPSPLPPTADLPAAEEWIPTLVSSQDPAPVFSPSPSPTPTASPPTHSSRLMKAEEKLDRPEPSARPRKRVRYELAPVQIEEEVLKEIKPEGPSRLEEPDLRTGDPMLSSDIPSSASSAARAAAVSSSLPPPSLPLLSLPSSLPAPPPLRSSLRAADPAILDLPDTKYRNPYFSNPADVPRRAREYAGRRWPLSSKHGLEQDEFVSRRSKSDETGRGKGKGKQGEVAWEAREIAPSRRDVEEWLKKDGRRKNDRRKKVFASQIDGPTQRNTQGFKFSQVSETADSTREKRYMSVMSLEVLSETKEGKLPDQKNDPVLAAFYSLQSDGQEPDNTYLPGVHAGLILVHPIDDPGSFPSYLQHPIEPIVVDSELELITALVDLVRRWDPDILAGWEVQSASWGYVGARMAVYAQDSSHFANELSPILEHDDVNSRTSYDADHSSEFQVSGRHVFNVWRLLRGDLNLNQYTFENVAFHLLHRRVPKYTPTELLKQFRSKVPSRVLSVLDYFLQRAVMVVEMLDVSELVSKNAEFARVYGVDFSDVFMRGSQFKVESIMFRLAKPESLLLLTPSKDQVGQQAGAECIPLILEPQSAFFTSPVVVLDFQSLYPSIMIAYNICYSTCLGRADRLKDKHGRPTDRFGFSKLELEPGALQLLEEYITISPNGMMFVKPTLRKSLLAKMLAELLDTRVMIKSSMKGYKADKGLSRVLNARQLALKLLANVTYGYTSASFSGRMPHIQVADAIVQYGRESLEKAINLIHSTDRWRARVVYGDTDSLFIHLPGRSKDQAFLIGNEIADAVTARNPKPMKLKFEKVYFPCVLQAKKRYVGFKYENPDDVEPVFDDKGIETVRRDGVPAQQKQLEACIKILFRSQDLSEVKTYCLRQWAKILEGRVSIQDFTFAKEVRLGTYIEKSRPPHVIVAAIRTVLDPADEPQYGERVPYVIVQGEPGEPQYKRARRPEELIENRSLRLDGDYYISNMLIPPLTRIFNLLGADVEGWYKAMTKPKAIAYAPFGRKDHQKVVGRVRMTSFFRSVLCWLCGEETSRDPAICSTCLLPSSLPATIYALLSHQRLAETRLLSAQLICSSCTASPAPTPVGCVSLDCPTFYARTTASRHAASFDGLSSFIERLGELEDEREERKMGHNREGEGMVVGQLSGPDEETKGKVKKAAKGKGRVVNAEIVDLIDLTDD